MSSAPITPFANPKKNKDPLRYARYGLALPRKTLKALEQRGIYCQPSISVEHQYLAGRYVLRGTESGGAVSDMGRYCGYIDAEGKPVPWLQPLDSLSGNGRHAIVIAPELIRIEMLRVGNTYELAISSHSLTHAEGRTRPIVTSALLFRGRQGTLALDLCKEENRPLRGSVAPVFYTPGGEVRGIPVRFELAIQKSTGALSCAGCKHTHIAVPPMTVGTPTGPSGKEESA